MAINKNFVVKNGIEVNTNLIVADTDSNKVGIGTTVPEYTLHVFEGAGIGVTNITVTGISTNLEELNVGVGGTTLTAISNATLGIGGSVGVGTDAPGYLLEVHSPVTSGQTALYVRGDMVVTGDINIDDISIGDLNVSGISTFVGNILVGTGATVGFGSTAFFKDYAKAIFGDGEDLKVYHDGSNSYISDTGTGGLIVGSNSLTIKNAALNETQAVFTENGAVELYYDNGKRFETNAIGVEVSGTLESTGITTLASSGGITTTGGDLYVGGDLYINEDIVLDTNLEILGIATIGSIHVTGISTFDGTINGPNLTNSVVVGTGLSVHGSATGVAVTLAGAGGITTTGGDLYVGGDLYINEDIVLDTNLEILGIATIGSLQISGTSGINTISSTVQSTSKDTGSLVLQGGLGIEKQLYVGAGASVGAGLTVAGNLLPEADGTRDLGSSGAEWKDLYIDGTANIDSLSADTAAIGDLTDNRVVIAGSSGELEDSADLTFDGTTLAVNAVFDSNDTTQSTSATTGSAQFAGGVGIEKQLYVGAGASVGAGFTIGTGIGVTTILDDDAFNNASATALASQQSIKAYVDAQVTASDLDFQGDSGGAQSVDLDSQTFTIAGTANEIETSGSGQTLTVGLPNFVTVSNGLNVTGNGSTTTTLNVTGIATIGAGLTMGDNVKAFFGNDGELQIFSNGTNPTIDAISGDLLIRNLGTSGDIYLDAKSGERGIKIIQDGAVEIYHDNSKKFETTSSGINVTGITTATELDIKDSSSNEPSLKLSTGTATNFFSISRSSSTGHYTFASEENGSRIIFSTDPDGNGTQERLTIDRYGLVGINTTTPTENLSVNGNVVFGHDQPAGNPGSTIGVTTVRGHHVNSDGDYAELYFANSKSSGGSTASIRAGREGDNAGTNLTFYTQQSGGSNGNGTERLRIRSDGGVVATGIATFSSTKHLTVPVGTTAQRDSIVANGMIRYNTTLNSYEGYGNGAWGGLGGGTEIDVSVSSTSATNLTTFAHASYRSASFRVQITQGTSYQVGKYMLIHDGTTVTMVEESAIATGDMLGDITSVINGSNVEIKVTMYSASSATVTTIIDKITV